nr:nitrate regulatory gene2 protein-like isoform X2 [Quercus suber]
MRKIYEKKCSRLRNQDVRGDDELSLDKTRAAVKDLYARILVAIRSAESISERIQKMRDEELQPQIVELLKGLTRTWKIMLESHETQNKILFEVRSFTCPTFGKFCNDTHRLATLQLEAELQNWHACFMDYVAAQKGYVEALHGWLSKFIAPEVEVYSRGSRSRNSAVPFRVNGPPLLVICHDWLASMDKLPDKAVAFALKSFAKDVRALWHQQGKEQQQKRKVDSLAKDLDRRILSFQKVESRFLESKLTEQKSESEVEHPDDYLTDKKDHLDTLRSKLDTEKEKHHNYMQETQRITLNGFQTGFSTIFESLVEFSKVSQNIYNDLVNCKENAEKAGNLSYIEDSKIEDNGSR